ncbi:MAG: 50S ribosomal protein L14 [uncultured DHVE6 group euryarchaeote]|jgi:large subunit ribosomal protein L14|nr:MAG: 50S ribosomal protein L14 [uncultured DHVE6 group euryarchaeote]
MRPIKINPVRSIPHGAVINIVDNSGARKLRVISVKGFKSRTRQLGCAGVADLVTGAVVAGNQDMKHSVVQAVIIRQKKEYARQDGMRVSFEDNAGVIIKDLKLGTPKGTVIKGPVAKEVALRWSQVGKLASILL